MISRGHDRHQRTPAAAARILGLSVCLGAAVLCAASTVHAQGPGQGQGKTQGQAPAGQPANKPMLVEKAIPTNPTDPIALVNGQVITREMLATECVVRRGEEILETMISRTLIDQAIKKQNLSVSAAEVNAEIDAVAFRMAGIGREAWLRTLDKERGISPMQYAQDIIYPTIALRKLAEPRVQVTEKDINEAFEAQYGDKLRCRIVMVDKLRVAQEIWEELKKNPNSFERIARERSMDLNTRSLGGLIAEPIVRHAFPRNVSDAAFKQLVDNDPKDKDPAHKFRDGDFTGPIQASESSWVILKRETLIPAQNVDRNDPKVKNQLRDIMRDAKLKEKMGEVFQELVKTAAIDNRLTGQVKLANEDTHPDYRDPNVKQTNATSPTNNPGVKLPPPPGVSPDEVERTERLRNAPGGTRKP